MYTNKLKRSDCAVIAVLWSIDFIAPWAKEWGWLTTRKIFGKLVYSNSYALNSFVQICFECICCIIVALIADMKNHKFHTYFFSLIGFSMIPLFGIIVIIMKYTVLAYMFTWLRAIYFVLTPIRFCSIFNQKPRATPDQTRLLVSFFEIIEGISNYLLVVSKETVSEYPVMFLIVVWTIMIPIAVLIITLTESVKKYVKKEEVTEPTIKATISGIKQDIHGPYRKKYIGQFVLFQVLLQPVLIVKFIDIILGAVNEESKRYVVQVTEYKKYQFLAQLVGLPLLCLALSLGKSIIGRFGDLLVIALAHVFNTSLCIMLYFYLRDKALFDQMTEDMLKGVPAGPGHSAILLMNGTESSYFVKTPFYETHHPVGVLYLDVYMPTDSRSFDLAQIQPQHKPLIRKVEIHRNKRYRFLTIGSEKNITKVVQVFGEDDFKVRSKETVLLIINGLVGETINGVKVPYDSKEHVIEILRFGQSIERRSLPPSNRFLKLYIPPGETLLYYSHRSDVCQNEVVACSIFQPVKLRLIMEPHKELTWVITHDGRSTRTNVYTTLSISPDEIEKAERVFISAYSFAGFAQTATLVGYTQFFWTESPLRLRTTLLAIFHVSNEITQRVTEYFVTDVGPELAVGCVALSCCGFIIHVIIGLWYDFRFRRELWVMEMEAAASKS